MTALNWSELGVFISVCGSVLVSLCFAIQKSRCDKIECCCMKIHRNPPPLKDIEKGEEGDLQNLQKNWDKP